MALEVHADRITAKSTVISIEGGGLRLDHRWVLTPVWQAQSVEIERWNEHGREELRLVRVGDKRWEVNHAARPDLDGAEDPDLSVTPFCNTFPIRRVSEGDPAQFGRNGRIYTDKLKKKHSGPRGDDG